MKKNIKVPVSERALFARIDRALMKEGKRLKKCRLNTGCFNNLGRYYYIDDRNIVIDHHISLVRLAKDKGLLAPHEEFQQ